MYLVLIETSGNQNYIFSTNKLRENVGASELTYRVGTKFVLEAVKEMRYLWHESPKAMRKAIIEQEQNSIEVVFAASGKALLLVPNEGIGKEIISKVTNKTIQKAPGIDACGVIVEVNNNLHNAIHSAHCRLEKVRGRIPGPAQRFTSLPIIDECPTSGLPAMRMANPEDRLPKMEIGPRSCVSLAKLAISEKWGERLDHITGSEFKLPTATTDLEKQLSCDWLAVIHADGNGLGSVFLHFDEPLKKTLQKEDISRTKYVDCLRKFSSALDECTETAFRKALKTLKPRTIKNDETGEYKDILPIVPILLGGDDFTAVCDGRQAMRFTCAFLEAFEEETGNNKTVGEIMSSATGQEKVTSCAGVAIIKPHFPFYSAYSLAEELIQSAKEFAKKESPYISAVDFHVLHDASGADLERIRHEWAADAEATQLTARPYALRDDKEPKNRRIRDLSERINTIKTKNEDGRRKLPHSILHDLRDGLFQGQREADARLQLQLGRRSSNDFGKLISEQSLFWEDNGKAYTGLLDAMELAEFWEGKKK
ncbi:MAG: hypothetical protein GC154_16935 [bacterium]|nr:hypothetical protein [bacterium]